MLMFGGVFKNFNKINNNANNNNLERARSELTENKK